MKSHCATFEKSQQAYSGKGLLDFDLSSLTNQPLCIWGFSGHVFANVEQTRRSEKIFPHQLNTFCYIFRTFDHHFASQHIRSANKV